MGKTFGIELHEERVLTACVHFEKKNVHLSGHGALLYITLKEGCENKKLFETKNHRIGLFILIVETRALLRVRTVKISTCRGINSLGTDAHRGGGGVLS